MNDLKKNTDVNWHLIVQGYYGVNYYSIYPKNKGLDSSVLLDINLQVISRGELFNDDYLDSARSYLKDHLNLFKSRRIFITMSEYEISQFNLISKAIFNSRHSNYTFDDAEIQQKVNNFAYMISHVLASKL